MLSTPSSTPSPARWPRARRSPSPASAPSRRSSARPARRATRAPAQRCKVKKRFAPKFSAGADLKASSPARRSSPRRHPAKAAATVARRPRPRRSGSGQEGCTGRRPRRPRRPPGQEARRRRRLPAKKAPAKKAPAPRRLRPRRSSLRQDHGQEGAGQEGAGEEGSGQEGRCQEGSGQARSQEGLTQQDLVRRPAHPQGARAFVCSVLRQWQRGQAEGLDGSVPAEPYSDPLARPQESQPGPIEHVGVKDCERPIREQDATGAARCVEVRHGGLTEVRPCRISHVTRQPGRARTTAALWPDRPPAGEPRSAGAAVSTSRRSVGHRPVELHGTRSAMRGCGRWPEGWRQRPCPASGEQRRAGARSLSATNAEAVRRRIRKSGSQLVAGQRGQVAGQGRDAGCRPVLRAPSSAPCSDARCCDRSSARPPQRRHRGLSSAGRPGRRSVTTSDPGDPGQQARRHGVQRESERQRGPVGSAHGSPEPGLGHGHVLHRNDNHPLHPCDPARGVVTRIV